jgi:exosortase
MTHKMNGSKDSEIPWNLSQKLVVGLFLLLFIGWFSASMEWKVSMTGKMSYLALLVSFLSVLFLLDRKAWVQMPNKGTFLVLLAAWLALFQFWGNSILGYIHSPSLFAWLHDAYNSPNPANDDSHGAFIPFLVAGLLWWKRKELLAPPLDVWWPGLLLFVLAMGLHILGYVLQQPRISVVALFTGIYGLTGLAWGRAWLKKSIFPFFLFVFSIPLGEQAKFITFPLRLVVCQLVEVVSHWILGIDVIRIGTQLIDPSGTYQYDVQAACSGIRSLVAIILLATAYGFLMFRSPWKCIFLVALAFPFAVLGNLLRMLLIVVAAELGGQQAGAYVHESTLISLVPYLPAFIGVFGVGAWMEKHRESAESEQP